ncbi:MAG: ArnT family glycosyltransferase [Anaerolineae bacterium]
MPMVRGRWGWLVLLVLLIATALAWRVPNLDAFSLSNDEGAHLTWAWLLHEGHPLYSETVLVWTPLLFVLLDWVYDLAGVGVVSGRALVLAFWVLACAALAWSARMFYVQEGEHASWLAALVAVLVFMLAPIAFRLSRMAMGEVPALALAVLAVALAQIYTRRGAWIWLLLSGLLYSTSLLVKAVNPLIVLPILWLVMTTPGQVSWRSRVARLAAWGVAALLPLTLCFVFYDPAAFYDQVIAFRFQLRAVYPLELERNLVWLMDFWRQHWGIVVLAVCGGVLLGHRVRWDALTPLGLWLIGGGILPLIIHSPLFYQHTVILLPPLALLCGGAAAVTWQLLRERRWLWGSLGAASAIALVGSMPGMVRANDAVVWARFGREAEAIALLQQVTRPDDAVISDNLMLTFMAQRKPPPSFGDLAQVAIDSGRQTSRRLIALSEAYRVEAVANWALRLPQLKEYMDWVERHYLVRRVWDNHHVLYFARKVSVDEVPQQHTALFEGGIALVGFDARLDETSDAVSSWLRVTAFWQATQPLRRDLTVFVHLYDASGRLVASHDGRPVHGYLPTTRWPVGAIVPDRHDFPLPQDLSAGDYILATGLYDPVSGVRLAVSVDGQAVDSRAVTLTRIAIPRPLSHRCTEECERYDD